MGKHRKKLEQKIADILMFDNIYRLKVARSIIKEKNLDLVPKHMHDEVMSYGEDKE